MSVGVVCASVRRVVMPHACITPRSQKVAVVGGGASGLISARECLKEGHTVRVFEKSTAAGGTWLVDPVPPELQKLNVLTEDYHSKAMRVHSSMYDNLRTNLPREIMGFSEFPFDETFPGSKDPRRFCTHQEVRRYLDAFQAQFNLDSVVQLDSSVVRVEHFDRPSPKWDVEVLVKGKRYVEKFDAVVVANGHYSLPNIPEIKGIEKFKNLCLHSHLYRRADNFKDMTVVILGNANSGRDLSQEISDVANDVYLCGRKWPAHVDLTKPIGRRHNIHCSTNIVECTGEGQLKLEDGSIVSNVDVLIFCTGYLYEFPFLKTGAVSTENRVVYPLYKHVVHPHLPTLAFTTLPYQVLPFIFAEYQSKYIARIFSGKVQLPDVQTMMDEINKHLEDYKKSNKQLMNYLNMSVSQFPYMDEIAELCGDVEPLPKWRFDMLAAIRHARLHYPDDYRNRDIDDPCFAAAREEFELVKNGMNQQEDISLAL